MRAMMSEREQRQSGPWTEDFRGSRENRGILAEQEARRILKETEPSGHEGHVDMDMLCILHAFEPYTDASLRDASLATLLAESLARFCAMDEAEAWEAFGE